MANLSIRNLDDEIVAALKRKAKARNRSLEAEVRDILVRAARKPEPEELIAFVERIAAMTPKGRKQTDSTKLIREDRRR